MYRQVSSATAPTIVTANSLYQPQSQPQPQPTIIAQHSLPKIGAIKATTLGANAQQKVLNIVKTQKASSPMIANAVVVTAAPAVVTTAPIIQTAMNHLPHIKAQHHPIVRNGTTNIITSDNIINTTSIAANRQILSAATITNSRNITAATIKSELFAPAPIHPSNGSKLVNAKNNSAVSKSINNPHTTHIIDTIKREPNVSSNPIIVGAESIATITTNNAVPVAAGPTKAAAAPQATNNQPPASIHHPAQQIEQKVNSAPPQSPASTTATTTTTPTPPPATTNDNNDDENEAEPEIDIVINNVVCSFSVRCHLNLREIALNGRNVEFRRENGMVTMKLRRPYTTASIWSSGRITCTGATSEDQV